MITCFPKSKLGFGPKVEEFENAFAKISKKKYNIGVNSASSASFMIFDYLYHIYGKCNVFIPSLAFTSPPWAAKKIGHQLIFVDVNSRLMFDFDSYKKINKNLIQARTVLMPILYGGNGHLNWKVDDEIVMVDAAHGLDCSIPNDFIFYSFHPQKPITMSSGGMISTNIQNAADFFFAYRNFGRISDDDSYHITQDGFKFYMDNPNAALGLKHIRTAKKNQQLRKKNYHILLPYLRRNPLIQAVVLHDEPSSYYLMTVLLKSADSCIYLRKQLKQRGIQTTFHYPFLHTQQYYYRAGQSCLPNLESLADKIINIPVHEDLKQKDLNQIILAFRGIK